MAEHRVPLNAQQIGAKSVPKFTLTDIAIKRLPAPAGGTRAYWDSNTKGLALRISPGGTKTFIVLIGSGRRHALGRYPSLSLSDARTEAKRLLAEKTLGKIRPTRVAFDDAKVEFLAECERKNKPRTLFDYTRLLKKGFSFARTPLADITPQKVRSAVNRLAYAPAEQNHAFVVGRAFFRWAVRQRYIDTSPMEHMTLPAKPGTRDRVLSDHELAAVYKVATKFPYPFGTIVQLLILTGQRRGEICALKWDWIGDDTLTLPGSLTKNKRPHTFPLGDTARAVMESLPRRSDYLFPASREHVRGKPTSVFNGWPKAKREFDLAVQGRAKKSPVAPWTLHDLRRTFATNLAALGTPIQVTEKLLNHISGTVSGVAAIYNRHTYMDEMRAAVAAWEARLQTLIAS
ncbi:MAG TPA: site-specific integrase [Bauldia sp.]|nr:site-specific integrase [Bauldia sp.]